MLERDDKDTALERKSRARPRRIGITDHALLRFIERGSRIPLDMHWLSLHRRRFSEGNFQDPSDGEILDHISQGNSLVRVRRRLQLGLDAARPLYRTRHADFVAIGGSLVALVDRKLNTAVTVITAEMAKSSMPISRLRRSGIFSEAPAPTLSVSEREASSGFRYAIRHPNLPTSAVMTALRTAAPEIDIVAVKDVGEVIAIVRLCSSLMKIRSLDGFVADPYIASREEFLTLEAVASPVKNLSSPSRPDS